MALARVPFGEKLGKAARLSGVDCYVETGGIGTIVFPPRRSAVGCLRSIALDRDRAAFAELFGHFAPRVRGS